MKKLLVASAISLVGVSVIQEVQAQMAPSGYTGVINVPTADVIAQGSMVGAWSNSNPEATRQFKGYGPFGGYNLGFGLLPNFEAVARLTYDGNLSCDMYESSCKSTTRDISAGGKYKLPLPTLPLNTRIAVGMTDYGGASTLYRQTYGVATSTMGPLDVSVGKSRAQPGPFGGGLIQGKFGGAALSVADNVKLLAESDSREKRVGVLFHWRPLPDWGLGVLTSRKLTHSTQQQASQIAITLSYDLDGRAVRRGQPSAGPNVEQPLSTSNLVTSSTITTVNTTSAHAEQPMPSISDSVSTAQELATNLEAAGFSEISVGKDGLLWHIKAEPRSWRKNRLDAMAAGLAVWLKAQGSNSADVMLTLTYMQNPVAQARTSSACLLYYSKGVGLCDRVKPILLKSEPVAMAQNLQPVEWLVKGHASQFLRPDFELSPSASYAVGTEFGLTDYSLGLSKGWEVPLYKGLVWHGYHTQFLTESDDFANKQSYFRRVGLGEKTAWGANMLSYTRPLYTGLWAEVTSGYLSSGVKGTNLTMMWDSPDSRWKVTRVSAKYRVESSPEADPLHPTFYTVRYAVIPGKWALSTTKGTFLNNDNGTQVMSTHFFGDHRVRFYYRKTGPGNETTPNRRAFAGFNITLPIGPKESYSLGPATIRGRDQWALGLETKVGEKDNYIEPGYGIFPSIRHGLQADVSDYERGDVGYMEANMHRLWAGLREQMEKR